MTAQLNVFSKFRKFLPKVRKEAENPKVLQKKQQKVCPRLVDFSFENLACRFFLRFENLSLMFWKISKVLISSTMNFCQTFLWIPGKQFRIPSRNFPVRSLKQSKNIWKLSKVFRHGIRWVFLICKTCPCEKYPERILGDYKAGLSILPPFVCSKLDKKFYFTKQFNKNTLKVSC